METKQLIEEILKHEADISYWERQLRVGNRLIEITKGE